MRRSNYAVRLTEGSPVHFGPAIYFISVCGFCFFKMLRGGKIKYFTGPVLGLG